MEVGAKHKVKGKRDSKREAIVGSLVPPYALATDGGWRPCAQQERHRESDVWASWCQWRARQQAPQYY